MPSLTPSPLPNLRLTSLIIPPHPPSHLPNSPTLPLLLYHSAFPATTPPSTLESHLRANALTPQWRYTMYTQTHYHSTTHEVLCVYRGRARLLFGGEQNPARQEVVVGAGDVMVVPAGVAHRLLEDVGEKEGEGEFAMVGSYPRGCSWDICYGREGEEEKARKAAEVPWLEKDPVYGDDGPALWGKERLQEHQRGVEGK